MNVMDECRLYTINFATARPTAFTSLHKTRLHNTTVRQLLLSSIVAAPRRARQVCFSQFLLDTLLRAAGPYTGVLLEVQRDLTPNLVHFSLKI